MHDNHLPAKFYLNNQCKPRPNYKAFTLIELVMVIVLIGLLATVVGPRFFSLTSFNEKLYIQDLLSGLRYARLTAEVSNCRVQFNLQANGFELKQNQDCQLVPLSNNFSFTVKRPSEPDQAYINVEKPSTISVTSIDGGGLPASSFFFLPSGMVTNAAGTQSSILLTFTGAEVSENFTIEGGTGFVH